MQRMIPFKINNQKTVISLLAVGVGATLIGWHIDAGSTEMHGVVCSGLFDNFPEE